MGLISAEGIILSTKNWGSADKIIHIFTKNHGKISAIAYGCRRPKSPLSSVSQPFVELDLQISTGEHSNTIRQSEPKKFHSELFTDLRAMAYASFISDLVKNICHDYDSHPEIYDKLISAFPQFTKKNPRIIALALALQILEYTGYQLSFTKCIRCHNELTKQNTFIVSEGGAICSNCHHITESFPKSTSILIDNLLKLNWQRPENFSIKGADLLLAEKILIKQLNFILEKPLKSLSFLKQIGE